VLELVVELGAVVLGAELVVVVLLVEVVVVVGFVVVVVWETVVLVVVVDSGGGPVGGWAIVVGVGVPGEEGPDASAIRSNKGAGMNGRAEAAVRAGLRAPAARDCARRKGNSGTASLPAATASAVGRVVVAIGVLSDPEPRRCSSMAVRPIPEAVEAAQATSKIKTVPALIPPRSCSLE
jgi:hypothetical protein